VLPTRKPTPGEPLWTIRVNHVTWSAELRFHGESYGWAAQILRNGELFVGHRCVLHEVSVRSADEQRFIERGLKD
jgi:hypothetical protein